MKYIATVDHLADIFTKSLSTPRFQFLHSKIMVFVDPMILRGMIEEAQTHNAKIAKTDKENPNGWFPDLNDHINTKTVALV